MNSSAVPLAVLAAFASAGLLFAEEAAPKPQRIAALSWLEGSWRSAEGAETWEACYSGPAGGEIVSATKQIRDGKVTLFDFERFREQDGKIVLTPFPRGRASVDFELVGFDPAVQRATFVNAAHDFPQRMKYERTPDGHLKITLAGDQGGKHVGFTLDLAPKSK